MFACLVVTDLPKKAQKKQYAKANITNSADKLIRKELDDADGILEKVIWIPVWSLIVRPTAFLIGCSFCKSDYIRIIAVYLVAITTNKSE